MKKVLFASSAIALAVSTSAFAQQETSNASENRSTSLDSEIVVTAQKREETIQDVPVAVTAFGSESRDLLGVRDIQDFANFTPGLSYSTSLDRLSLRGVGRLTNLIGSDPGVATYNDGFYTSSTVEASKTPMFVDRVEILRGPQGTLYGRNSVGGAVNVISKRPTREFEGEARVTVEEVGGTILEGLISGPVTDKLSARFTVQYGPNDGEKSFDNIAGLPGEGFRDRTFVEGQLQYDFDDVTSLWVKYSQAEWNDHFRSANLVTPYETTVIQPGNALVPNAAFGLTDMNPGVADERTINTNTRSDQKLDDNHTVVVNFDTEWNDFAIKYVGGYQNYRYTQLSDLDYTDVDLVVTSAGSALGPYSYNPTYVQEYIEDKEYYSNEVTISGDNAESVQWILGLYQYHEDFYQPITQFVDGDGTDNLSAAIVAPINPFTGLPSAPNPRGAFYQGLSDLEIDSYAIFGQADFEASEKLTLTAGLRYSIDEKTGDESYRLVNWNPTSFVAACFGGCGPFTQALDITPFVAGAGDGSGPATRTLSDEWEGFSWRLAADYDVNDTTHVFASYSRGLKAGGFNLGSFSQSPIVDKEEIDAFEIGFKSDPTDEFRLNMTAYYYKYMDIQVPLAENQGGISVTNFFNIPEAETFGLEVETSWLPTPWLELRGVYSYLDAEFTETDRTFDDTTVAGVNFVDIKGNRTPQASEHQVGLTGLVDFPIENGNLFFAASYSYRSDAFYSVFENERSRAPGWDRVDLRLTWVDPTERYTAILFGRNVFDEIGYDGATGTNGSGSTGFGQIYSFTQPQSFGVELQARF